MGCFETNGDKGIQIPVNNDPLRDWEWDKQMFQDLSPLTCAVVITRAITMRMAGKQSKGDLNRLLEAYSVYHNLFDHETAAKSAKYTKFIYIIPLKGADKPLFELEYSLSQVEWIQ